MRLRMITAGLATGALVGALAVAVETGPALSSSRPPERATSDVPADGASARQRSDHGSLLRAAPFHRALTLERATNTLLRYRQVAVDGGLTKSRAVLSVPKGAAPDGGWPVLVQAHGSTGLADRCAPSRQARWADDDGDRSWDPMQDYVDGGYAVLRPDYEGLAGPGLHPWLIGRSEGRSLLDAARAARAADPTLSTRTAILGFSQGGHAALFAAAMAPTYTPETELLGTVAIAPVSDYSERLERRSWNPDGGPGPGGLVMLAATAQLVDPTIEPRRLLSRRSRPFYDDVIEECLGDVDARDGLGGVPIEKVFRPRADLSKAVAVARANEPRRLTITTPLLVLQGEDDITVARTATDDLVDGLWENGADPTYRTYPGVDHGSITDASEEDARDFLRALVGR